MTVCSTFPSSDCNMHVKFSVFHTSLTSRTFLPLEVLVPSIGSSLPLFHMMEGEGVPAPEQERLADSPGFTMTLLGCSVNEGGTLRPEHVVVTQG